MPCIFRDASTKKILLIDFGNPEPNDYAKRMKLSNWISEAVDEATARKLFELNFPSTNPVVPPPNYREMWKTAGTVADKLAVLEKILKLI